MLCQKISEDLELRPLEEEDAEELFALVDKNREYLRKWLPWLDANTCVDHSRNFILLCIDNSLNKNEYHTGIWHYGRLAGLIGCHGIDNVNLSAGMGYWLGDEYQGKGLMIRSCKAMIDHAFNELYLNRIEIRCAVENKRSRVIPERLGFVEEGTLREAAWLNDRFIDLVVYGMIKRDWQS
ncbi:RimJ/RimL family protein N-acetyltransferase [Methanocella sp. CWC-04]|uniref:RimJ/RimL family protein N-acetyltransferase n=1 Tax=Methanooceanicella nereidis TaxID=2052831 RepID=A0AAP2W5X7_9EURY|nr:GNAT family protein [Methanocella sp. CWC-04]MCD1294763.1 RimJ/RimL family protein N-acetyltransferase [Methanocella sp. CWC-04]